jgi:spore maturation protein CgeB
VNILLVARFNDARFAHAALYQRALERLGATVTPFNLERTGWLDRVTGKDLRVRLEQAIRHAGPEVVLSTDGEVLREGVVETLRGLSAARWVHWFAWQTELKSSMARAIQASDLVFMAGAGRADRWSRETGMAVTVLDAGCDPSVHRPLRVREPFRANVVFAGSASPYREAVLSQLVEFGLAIWGPGWKKSSLREYCRGELISLENYVRAYAGATVGINLQRQAETAGSEGALNARLFELAGIGVLQAVEHRSELATHFDPGVELLTYHGVEELREKVRQALADQALRDRMASAARHTALQRHTYMHRMLALLERVNAGSEESEE